MPGIVEQEPARLVPLRPILRLREEHREGERVERGLVQDRHHVAPRRVDQVIGELRRGRLDLDARLAGLGAFLLEIEDFERFVDLSQNGRAHACLLPAWTAAAAPARPAPWAVATTR